MSARAPLVFVAAKRSQYQKHVRDQHDPRALELLARHDLTVARWQKADSEHRRTYDAVVDRLRLLGANVVVLSRPHAEFDAHGAALVVTVGGDGTLLAASHNVADVPILGVNSSPDHSVGFFCSARRETCDVELARALEGQLGGVKLARMRVDLNGRVYSSRLLNEALFSHIIPAATSRYILERDGRPEDQRSSGFWIGPAAGSTGALRSAGGHILPLRSRKLQLVVREPYESPGARVRWRRFEVSPGKHLEVRSKMDDAALFLDGPFRRVEVHLGDLLRFSVSDESLHVLGIGGKLPARSRTTRRG